MFLYMFLLLFLFRMVLSTLFLGGSLMASNDITAGQLMAFLVASQGVQRSLSQGSILLGTMIRGMTAGSRVFEVLLYLLSNSSKSEFERIKNCLCSIW